jgi:1-acyl-sn-glycerol-3-phosphate acyltransferase
MAYKHGQPVINLSPWFRFASALTFYFIIPIATLINIFQHSTRFRNRRRLKGIKRAITVSNHTTFMDPVKISCLVLPRLIYQTLLEATVESPVLGTFTRLLGGVPIPRGKNGYRKILEICNQSFKYRRYLHFYPEGECFLYNQKINEFQSGAFRIAAELDIPVIPLVTVFSTRKFFGRTLPTETLVVLEPVYPAQFVRRNEKGELISESIKEFAEAVRQIMQQEIETCKGTSVFYQGQMKRIKGINNT